MHFIQTTTMDKFVPDSNHDAASSFEHNLLLWYDENSSVQTFPVSGESNSSVDTQMGDSQTHAATVPAVVAADQAAGQSLADSQARPAPLTGRVIAFGNARPPQTHAAAVPAPVAAVAAVQPIPNDVLCKRHPSLLKRQTGNIEIQKMIQECLSHHQKLKNNQKKELVDIIISLVDGRFLQWNKHDKCWVEVVDQSAKHDKVAQMFRTKRKPPQKRNKMKRSQDDH